MLIPHALTALMLSFPFCPGPKDSKTSEKPREAALFRLSRGSYSTRPSEKRERRTAGRLPIAVRTWRARLRLPVLLARPSTPGSLEGPIGAGCRQLFGGRRLSYPGLEVPYE